jgi:thiamine biosynthesis protein ThiS
MSESSGKLVDVTINGKPQQLADGLTISQLLSELGIVTKAIAVEINQEIQTRDCFDAKTISAGDSLEIVTLVGGG